MNRPNKGKMAERGKQGRQDSSHKNLILDMGTDLNEYKKDEMKEIKENIRKAQEYSRQASVLSVAAIVICAVTLIIIRVVLA